MSWDATSVSASRLLWQLLQLICMQRDAAWLSFIPGTRPSHVLWFLTSYISVSRPHLAAATENIAGMDPWAERLLWKHIQGRNMSLWNVSETWKEPKPHGTKSED